MKDQVAALSQAGIPAVYINSSLDAEEYREVYRRIRQGDCKLLYIAPERLQAEGFRRLLEELPVSLVAVDEAHCVSQWGQDFRPSYLEIAELVRSLPARPPVGAFTATATEAVRRDIETLLELRDPLRVTTGFDRPNLFFEVVRARDKDQWLHRFLAERPEQSGIVYCATRKAVDAVCASLLAQGIPAARYHAGMEDQDRRQSQEGFVYDQARVMVATNAFGMGIDKSNVGFVVHYNMPKDLESYYQEAGRAGRDGSPARCVLLYAPGDVRTAKFLITNSQETRRTASAGTFPAWSGWWPTAKPAAASGRTSWTTSERFTRGAAGTAATVPGTLWSGISPWRPRKSSPPWPVWKSAMPTVWGPPSSSSSSGAAGTGGSSSWAWTSSPPMGP